MNNYDEIEEFDRLKTKVLKYVLYKKRTESEIKMKFMDIPSEILEDIINNLKENGYINDSIYIEKAISEFINLKNMSINEIKYKLMAKGLSKDDIDNYIYQNKEKLLEYEINSAKNIFTKKQNLLEKDEIEEFLRKKGYLSECIKLAQERIGRLIR